MMHKITLFILILGYGIANGAVQRKTPVNKAIPITTAQERKAWLNRCDDFLKAEDDLLIAENNLFVYEEMETEKIPLESAPIVEQKEETSLTDEIIILQKVGEAIKPTGHVVINGEFALCLHGSRIITTKTVLNAKSGNQNYKITVESITRNQFTLQLNQNTHTFNY